MLKLISKEDEAKALELKAQANKAFAGKPLRLHIIVYVSCLDEMLMLYRQRLQRIDRLVYPGNLAQPSRIHIMEQ